MDSTSSNPQAIVACNGKVFQNGQIWSYCSGINDFPLYYGVIQKISAIQVAEQETKYKLHVRRFMATRSPDDVVSPGVSVGQMRKRSEHGDSCNTRNTERESKTVPPHRNAERKPEALCFPKEGKVFQAGQVWSFSNGYSDIPRYYGRIQNITLSQGLEQAPELELHVGRLRVKPYQKDVIQWKDKRMPIGCGSFLVNKGCTIFPPSRLLHQLVRQTSMEGNECTILPKIGDVWAIYQTWDPSYKLSDLEANVFDFEMVEVLDDASDFKVLSLESVYLCNRDGEKKEVLRAAKSRTSYCCDDEDGVIFTIKKSKMRRFSHWIPASKVTNKIKSKTFKLA
ncbi:unnamed protein product [Microthlaspi erraticum]|uniref:DUF3444 domain-containing protein n=1 Tax=Microthlaspi erraticum TaxID=1685480 RepID=A0A6D2L5J4_9BRAS|nr:unnamed protein product [Microthlaspi erraticum]